MAKISFLSNNCDQNCYKLNPDLLYKNSCRIGKGVLLLIRISVSFYCLLLVAPTVSAQEKTDTTRAEFHFSGTLSLTTNGISPIPAFSLEKPAITGFLSLRKKRFSYDPEMAFSIKGIPWFFNNCFRYRLIEKPRFQFRTALIWGIGNSYPQIVENGRTNSITKAERFFWLELMPRYKISEKIALSSITYSGYNFEPGSVKRINYISLIGNFTKIRLKQNLYYSFFPQLFYLNLDGSTDGFFASGVLGIGHNKVPLFLSMQMNETLTTTISPNPGFKWNISLAYSF
jgi:hypothetical protein